MGCKYILKLQNGIEIELDSIFENRDDSLSAFKKSLEQQLLKDEQESGTKIEEILKSIESSKKPIHNIKEFNATNAIGTTSIGFLVNSLHKIPNNKIQNTIIEGIQSLTEWIKINSTILGFNDIYYTNVIAASFESDDHNNLIAKYFPERQFLVVDVNKLSERKHENILKGLIDYSLDMLKNDLNFLNQINTLDNKFKTYEDFYNFMQTLPNIYDGTQDDLLFLLENKLGIKEGTLRQLYFIHDRVVEGSDTRFEAQLKASKNNSLEKQANLIHNKYKLVASDYQNYYTENQESEEFPFLNPGDLIKYKADDAITPFYIYVGTYESKSLNLKTSKSNKLIDRKREHVIISKEGYLKTVTDEDLKFDNKFIYKKNITTDKVSLDESKKYDDNKHNLKEDYYHLNFKAEKVSKEILKTLENGDLVYIKKKGRKDPIKHYVLGSIGNNLIVLDENNRKLQFSLDVKIHSLKLLKKIHNEFQTIDGDTVPNFYNIENGFIANTVKDGNLDNLLENLKVGDIIRVKSKNGKQVYHNLVVGYNKDKSEISILNNKDEIIEIDKSQILSVIYNFKNIKDGLVNSRQEKSKIVNLYDNFIKNNYFTYVGNANYDSYYNILDVSIPSLYTNDLKSKILNKDFVVVDNKIYYITDITPEGLIGFDLTRGIKKINFNDVSHIIKSNFTLPFESKTLQINSIFVRPKDDPAFQKLFNSGNYEMIEMKYVRNKSNSSLSFNNTGIIPGAYWISKDEFDANKYDDLTELYSQKEYGKGEKREMYSIKAITNNGKRYSLKNTEGYTKIGLINSLDINEFLNIIEPGLMFRTKNAGDFKWYRIENILNNGSNQGIYASYSVIDPSGKIINYVKFFSKESISDNGKLNLQSVYSPYYFNLNKKINEKINISSFNNNQLVNKKDNFEVISVISNHLKESFGVKINLINEDEIPEDISNGRTDIKAYILNKEIFINLDKADIASPIHEMMHLILGTIKTTNRNIYLTLINNAKNHPDFNQVLKKYANNTKLDIYEEIFVDLFTNTLKGKIKNNFNLTEIDNIIKNTLNEMLRLGSNLDSISGIEILNTSFEDIINTFGSDLFINQSEYYNPVIATKSIKLSSLKRKLIEDGELKEQCNE